LSRLRELARLMPCMVRVPNVCNGNPETTVLAHYRLSGVSGMGFKAPDICGAWACSACHAWIDTHHDPFSRIWHLEGMVRTLDALNDLGAFEGERWEKRLLKAIDAH
jgi:Protein of unknown function (DUF1364)